MANNCLVTKLKAVVDNPNLPSIYDFDYSGIDGLKSLPWKNVLDRTAALPWNSSSDNVVVTQFYAASNGDVAYNNQNNKERLVSDYIPVYEGMVISTNSTNTATVPIVICFDENKQPLGPSETYCLWKISDYGYTNTLTIPSGVKYIVINFLSLSDDYWRIFIRGSKPASE